MSLTPKQRTAGPRTILSGLLVLILMLVWQISPGLRPTRAGNGAERLTSVLRIALPPEAVKSVQIGPAQRSSDDASGASPVLIALRDNGAPLILPRRSDNRPAGTALPPRRISAFSAAPRAPPQTTA